MQRLTRWTPATAVAAAMLPAVMLPAARAATEISSIRYTLTFGVETPAPVFGGPFCFDEGCIGWPSESFPDLPETVNILHTDIDVAYDCADGFGFDAYISHDWPTVDRRIEFDQGLLYVNQFAALTVPVSGFEFTGSGVGDPLWILPANDPGDVLYIGVSSEPTPVDVVNNLMAEWTPPNLPTGKWFAYRLRSVSHDADGDGAFDDNGVFSMWRPVPLTIFMSSLDDGIPGNGITTDGITDQDVYYDIANGHNHMNWGFNQPGIYRVELQVTTIANIQLADPRFDDDFDFDVDLADFARMQQCTQGVDSAYPCGCEWADSDIDGDVDADDFVRADACWFGADLAADPMCDD